VKELWMLDKDAVSKEYTDEINQKSRYTKTLQVIGEIVVMHNYNTEKSEPPEDACVPNEHYLYYLYIDFHKT
jgi:hypothetical protein